MKALFRNIIFALRRKMLPDIEYIKANNYSNQVAQKQLFFYYQQLSNLKLPLPKWDDTGFRVYSQNDEDGLLLYLFSQIGFKSKICVDIGFGSPYGANSTNLICNWGFTGLLIEANVANLKQSKQFFASHKDTWIYPPKLVHARVAAENINSILEQNDITGEIDLFSLDVDGVDYYLWKNLEVIRPRVVVVEYMNIWGPDKAVTVPYRRDFNRLDTHPDYFGASLGAFVKLGCAKGYRLIGCNRYGFNAFFVRSDIGEDVFPEILPAQCLKHPHAIDGNKNRLPHVINYEWIEV